MVYNLRFFSSKYSLLHNSNLFGSLLFTFYIQSVLKLKKKIPAPKGQCYPSIYGWVFQAVSFPQVFSPEFCIHITSSPIRATLLAPRLM